MLRVALNSYGSIPTGLGSEARWLWNRLHFTKWIQARHPKLGYGRDTAKWAPIRRPANAFEVKAALYDVDVLVMIERPFPIDILYEARQRKIKTVMLTNPEWTAADTPWLPYVDVLVARTQHAYGHLSGLQHRNELVFAEAPMDLTEFPFRRRTRADIALYSDGWGGVQERKGYPAVLEIAKLNPDRLVMRSQRRGCNVEASADLYKDVDVMFVPSRFEGLGLTILEAMASGCLVLATDASPMSDFVYNAYGAQGEKFLLPVESVDIVKVGDQPWRAHNVDPCAAIEKLDALRRSYPQWISRYSRLGRSYVERVHGPEAAKRLWEIITR